MKTMTKVAAALVALAGVAGVAVAVQADSRWQDRHGSSPQQMQQAYGGHGMHDRHGHGGRHGMHHRGRSGGRHMTRMMDSFDANQDGKLSQAEIDQSRDERFAAFDSDGDRSLTLEEYEKLWLDAMREAMVDRFQYLDADGDAQVTAEEFQRPFAKTVRRMDRNEDGFIDRNDFKRRHQRDHGDSRKEEDNG